MPAAIDPPRGGGPHAHPNPDPTAAQCRQQLFISVNDRWWRTLRQPGANGLVIWPGYIRTGRSLAQEGQALIEDAPRRPPQGLAGGLAVADRWPFRPMFKLEHCPRRQITTSNGMQAIDLAPYCIHATDPASDALVEYECVGFALAHEKAVELREAGFKNVVLSLAQAPDGSETAA